MRRTDYSSGEVRGLMFVIGGVGAMFAYYPMYRDALRQVFALSLAGAGALALTLIIFNGAAGAIFEAALDSVHGLARPK